MGKYEAHNCKTIQKRSSDKCVVHHILIYDIPPQQDRYLQH